jgi:hypothetical protein
MEMKYQLALAGLPAEEKSQQESNLLTIPGLGVTTASDARVCPVGSFQAYLPVEAASFPSR